MMRRVASCLVVAAVIGCNAILDNRPGVLHDVDGSATEIGADGGNTPPSKPPPSGPDAATPDGSTTCDDGEVRCGDECVSADDPFYGCGSCTPCSTPHARSTCRGSACAIATCDEGFADCNQDAADGCETDLSRPESCGACDQICPPAAPTCAPAPGGGFSCGAGCPPGAPLLCGVQCVDPLTDPKNCGACEKECALPNATGECVGGQCSFTCRPNHLMCAGLCARCPPPAPNMVPSCAGAACVATCEDGFGDCDMNPADGCEVDVTSDAMNCGACGNPCPDGHGCVARICVPLL